MNIFNTKTLLWNDWLTKCKEYMTGKLGEYGNKYGPSNIFGQILTVLNSMTQNLMLYIEDSMTEQNVYTAQRKKSIYGLARSSGYTPSLGSAAHCVCKFTYTQQLPISNVVIPNKTSMTSMSNGLKYNILLDKESIIVDTNTVSTVDFTLVEGNFDEQTFISSGGPLYSLNTSFTGDVDVDYLKVFVNDEEWEMVDSLYDMSPEGRQFMWRVSLSSGIDIIFGDGKYGRILNDGDSINIKYLSHSGELGNISQDDDNFFIFSSPLKDINGNEIDGSQVFTCVVNNNLGVCNGCYSETVAKTKQMIGFNSRSMVLADSNNYKLLLSKYSFVGYNRCWSTPGKLDVNALVIKDYKQKVTTGKDYFNLREEDFFLNLGQKESLKAVIANSGMQYGGVSFNFIDPELKKYVLYFYVRMKNDVSYNKTEISNSIKNIIGNFFSNVYSDIYISKSDIIYNIKKDVPEIDGLDLQIISKAKEDGDEVTGLDTLGNILLEDDTQFPVIMGGWRYRASNGDEIQTSPINIIYL